MPFTVRVAGAERRVDLLPITKIDELERRHGKTIFELARTSHGLRAIAALLVGEQAAKALRVDQLEVASDDRPTEHEEHVPVRGGRTADRLIVQFAGEPWRWPPDVTKRQCLRDLQVIAEAYDDGT